MLRFTHLLLASLLVSVLAGCDTKTDETSLEPPSAVLSTPGNKNTHLFLGTGSVQGVYFPIGGVICRLLNRHKSKHRIRCSLESTGGSVYNLKELRAGNFDLVFAQSDWQFHAYHGSSTFEKEGANQDLRAVFALEADPIVLLVKKPSEIQRFDDLAERTVSFGYTRSLQHRIMDDLLEVKNWTHENFREVRPMSDTKQIKQLCEEQIEAALVLSSSLNDHLATLGEDCQVRMVSISGKEVKEVIQTHPYYRTGKILKSMHPGMEADLISFGIGATFVASESTSPKAIYHVVKEVVENFRDFKSLHPSLAALDKDELSHAGISIPLHPGAVRYYKEARLLK